MIKSIFHLVFALHLLNEQAHAIRIKNYDDQIVHAANFVQSSRIPPSIHYCFLFLLAWFVSTIAVKGAVFILIGVLDSMREADDDHYLLGKSVRVPNRNARRRSSHHSLSSLRSVSLVRCLSELIVNFPHTHDFAFFVILKLLSELVHYDYDDDSSITSESSVSTAISHITGLTGLTLVVKKQTVDEEEGSPRSNGKSARSSMRSQSFNSGKNNASSTSGSRSKNCSSSSSSNSYGVDVKIKHPGFGSSIKQDTTSLSSKSTTMSAKRRHSIHSYHRNQILNARKQYNSMRHKAPSWAKIELACDEEDSKRTMVDIGV